MTFLLIRTTMKTRFSWSCSPMVLLVSLVIGLSACEQALIKPNPANKPVENFDLLWKTVDEKYSYFTYKNIDWKALYGKYRPRIKDDMSEEELFRVMGDMLYELKDGHVNLVSPFDVSRNWEWYLGYPANFNETILERNYLGSDYQIARPFQTKLFNDSVGYIRYSSFLSLISEEVLDRLIKKYANTSGIIIDIRDNTGGAIAMVNVLAARFVEKKTLMGYNRYKAGPGHNDFTKAYPKHLEPKGTSYKGKVVVLTNRKVYSAANEFAAYMAELPNVTLIGDQTGGGGGAPISGELMNGWTFRFSANQLLNPRMEQIEFGVPADIKVDISPADEAAGKDTILETALQFLAQ